MIHPSVRSVLDHYSSEPPGVRVNLARVLQHGMLANSGKLLVLPVDQGVEHGPSRSFAVQPAAFDPLYHVELAVEAGCSAYVAPLGAMQVAASEAPGELPMILKVNGSEQLSPRKDRESTVTAGVADALRLGCVGIGLTLYSGSRLSSTGYQEARELIAEARSVGLLSVVWAYPRGEGVSKEGETAVDVVAYAAHLACQLGAHIVKIKPPSAKLEHPDSAAALRKASVPLQTLAQRVAYVKRCCLAGRRIVLCSGGPVRTEDEVLAEIAELVQGGAGGSIVGRNCFQRPKEEAVALMRAIMQRYLDRPPASPTARAV